LRVLGVFEDPMKPRPWRERADEMIEQEKGKKS